MKLKLLIGGLLVLNLALVGLLLGRERSIAPVAATSQKDTALSEPAPPPVAPALQPAPVEPQPQVPAAMPVVAAVSTPPPPAAKTPAQVRKTPRPKPAAKAPVIAEATLRDEPVTPVAAPPESVSAKLGEPVLNPITEPERDERPAPPPPSRPALVEVPAGTAVPVKLTFGLNSRDLKIGDSFEAELGDDLEIEGRVVARAGSPIKGVVSDLRSAGRARGVESLSLTLSSLEAQGGRDYRLDTSVATFAARETHKRDAATVGATTALGAIIGAIAHGGKGAATGAAAGAAAGTGVVLATQGDPVKLDAGTRLSFTLESPLRMPALNEAGRERVPESRPEPQANPNISQRLSDQG